ncbi:MAG TPA: alanyl-tRNA editing protein [Gemmatimonadaceae bacterium]|nr:alanyl-tRNA editing protein [Gemmatimonadaceae bacterium]
MTERLYYADAYLRRFDARVVGLEDDGRRVLLDRSAFYPTSGGQPHDVGTLAGVTVDDVVDEGARVVHVLRDPLPAQEGDGVHGEIAWERRFDHMQQHTGQHLVSALFADLCGYHTLSVHFGPAVSTLDLDTEQLSGAELVRVEQRANDIIAEGRAVTVTFEEAGTATGLRKASERDGVLRIVSIDGVDRSACGGTHVRSTSEIGVLQLRGREKVRRSMRIEFVCGPRAVRAARHDFELLQGIARALSAAPDEVARLVEGQRDQLREAQSAARRLQGELDAYRARARHEAAQPDAKGRRVVRERTREGSPDTWRDFALAFSALPRAVFIGVSESPPSVLLVASPDAEIDAGKVLRRALEPAGGRGGGSARMAQGSVPSRDALDAVLARLEAEW